MEKDKKEVKMLKKALLLSFILLILFLTIFSFSLLIGQQISSENIHYYLYEYTNEEGNKVAIIVEIASDNPTSPGSEFNEVTIEELCAKGYQTPSESENEAEVIDKGEDEIFGYGWSSWINAGYTSQNNKWIECGSRTSRPWYRPGSLFLRCTTYKIIYPPRPGGPIIRIVVSAHEHSTWGWYTKWVYREEYPSTRQYDWSQIGYHHWGNPQEMKISHAFRRW